MLTMPEVPPAPGAVRRFEPRDEDGRQVLVVHAHPDDEVFATGALTAWLAIRGCRVVLRVASGGEVAEGAPRTRSPAAARAARSRRLDRSCHELGIADWQWLAGEGRWTDTGGRATAGSLTSADPAELTEAVRVAIEQVRPRAVLTVGSDGLTGHPDHIAMHRAVVDAARRSDLVPEVWGASARAADVVAAHRDLAAHLGQEPVGSGRVRGRADSRLGAVVAPPEVGARRRAALDAYVPGLGTEPVAELLRHYGGRGDSLLVRGLLDRTGWHVEHYEVPGPP